MTGAKAVRDPLDQLARLAPDAVGGYQRIRSVIESEGALTVAQKALMVALGAAVRCDLELARSEIARGRAARLRDVEIAVGAAALLLSRGQSACERLLTAAGELTPDQDPLAASGLDATEYFQRYNRTDALPPRLAILAERMPAVFDGYFRMHHATLAASPELAKLGELALCCLNTADLRGDFLAAHATGARRAGASEQELIEAAVCAMPVAGVGAWAVAAAALFPES